MKEGHLERAHRLGEESAEGTLTGLLTGPISTRFAWEVASGKALESYQYFRSRDRWSKAGIDQITGAGVYLNYINTHLLFAIGSDMRTHDANGNTTASVIGGHAYGFAYNSRNRLILTPVDGTTAGTYELGSHGAKARKKVPSASADLCQRSSSPPQSDADLSAALQRLYDSPR